MEQIDFNLMSACHRGEAHKVDHYLSEGANPNIVATRMLGDYANRGDTPLLVGCRHGRASVVRRLIEANADVNYRVPKLWTTALMVAVSKQDYEIGYMLVDAGADINAQDKKGNTVLMQSFYAHKSSLDWLKYLLDLGADVFMKNKNGLTVLDRAKMLEVNSVYDLLETYRDNKVLDNLIGDDDGGFDGLLF